jgi:competence protein ComEC
MQDRVSPKHLPERLRFRRAPLAAAALWFASGILLAHFVQHQTIQIVASLAILGILALAGLTTRAGTFAVAAVWIVLGVAAAHWQPSPPDQHELLAFADNLSRTVRGHVVRVRTPPPVPESNDTDPVPPWEAAEDTSDQRGQPIQLDLAVDEIEQVTPDVSTMIPISGGVRVSVYQPAPNLQLRCGDRIELPLRLKAQDTFRTPGAFDYGAYLLSEGIAAHANVATDKIAMLGASTPTVRCRLDAAQQASAGRMLALAASPLNRRLPPFLRLTSQDASMLDAMLFGDRSGLDGSLRTGFERTGTFHLFVVSGLHIALVAAGLYWLLRRVRAPVWLATAVTLAGTAAYAALTGFGQPAQRALTMTAVFLLARLLGRDRDSLNALGAAVLAMLALAPSSLFDASFQMTVLVILAIAGIAVPLAGWTPLGNARVAAMAFRPPRRALSPRQAELVVMLELWGEAVAGILGHRARRLPAIALGLMLRGLELTLIGMVAELVMVLPMAIYFHRLPVFAVPANMLVLPAIAILVPIAIATFLASLASLKLALAPSIATAALLHAIAFAIHRIAGLRAADLRIPGPAWPVAITAVLGWLACAWLARRNRLGALAAALALPLIALSLLYPEPSAVSHGKLEVTALDVGQGDSVFAVNPDGQTMLIDAGGPIGLHGVSEIVSRFDIGEQVVAPYLWSRRIRRLDILVLSHAHTDHMGGMPAILADLRPRELWVGADPNSALYRQLLAQAASLRIPVLHVHAGDSRAWGPVAIDVLAPASGYTNPGAPKNDDSVVLHLQYGKSSVLLEGDAERPSENAMLAAHLIQPVTLLKVGHHGSKTSSNPEFLAAARPQDAVISVGRNNPFGHPKPEVIERFAEAHARLFRTDEFGITTFLLDRDGRIRTAPFD